MDLEMKPGRELDALIPPAEKVMGWHRLESDVFNATIGWLPFGPGTGKLVEVLPEFSTDIAAAWEIVEKVWPNNGLNLIKRGPDRWIANFDNGDGKATLKVTVTKTPTAPMVICLAALEMVDK